MFGLLDGPFAGWIVIFEGPQRITVVGRMNCELYFSGEAIPGVLPPYAGRGLGTWRIFPNKEYYDAYTTRILDFGTCTVSGSSAVHSAAEYDGSGWMSFHRSAAVTDIMNVNTRRLHAGRLSPLVSGRIR